MLCVIGSAEGLGEGTRGEGTIQRGTPKRTEEENRKEGRASCQVTDEGGGGGVEGGVGEWRGEVGEVGGWGGE